MYRAFRLGIMLSVVALLPMFALGQGAQQAKIDPAKVRAKLLMGNYIDGKLNSINEEEKTFSFQYTYVLKKPNPQGQAKLADISRKFNMALAMRNTALDTLKAMQTEGRAALKAAWDVEETAVPIEFKGEKNMPVRTLIAPTGADGKPKKLTQAEIAKLKGDPRLPGLMATIKDLDMTNWVRVQIDKSKIKVGPKDTDSTVYPISMILLIPEPKDTTPDPFVIPGM